MRLVGLAGVWMIRASGDHTILVDAAVGPSKAAEDTARHAEFDLLLSR